MVMDKIYIWKLHSLFLYITLPVLGITLSNVEQLQRKHIAV